MDGSNTAWKHSLLCAEKVGEILMTFVVNTRNKIGRNVNDFQNMRQGGPRRSVK